MQHLIPIVRLELALILGGLALVVVYKMLTGTINMRGLLDDRVSSGHRAAGCRISRGGGAARHQRW